MKCNLKQLRTNAGLNLQGLSELCGVSKQHLHALEKESSDPTLPTAYAIANVLNKKVYDVWPDSTEVIEEEMTVKVRRVKKP